MKGIRWIIICSVIAALVFSLISIINLRMELSELQTQLVQQDETLGDYEQELMNLEEANTELQTQLLQQDETLSDYQQELSDLEEAYRDFERGIVWSYGTGTPGISNGELYTPHMVEDLGDGKLLVVEQSNCDAIIIDKQTQEIIWQFGERGIAGTGNRLTAPHSARQIQSGPYSGDILITELNGDHRVLIVDFDTKQIVWETNAIQGPLDAIYWDDDHLMVSDFVADKIAKISIIDKTIVWEYSTPNPFYMQKLIGAGADPWQYGNSYGGDLLFGSTSGYVAEINTSTSSVIWQLGEESLADSPMLADSLYSPVSALRYGSGEDEDAMGSAITIIADEGNARILAVNKDKQTLWEIGGVTLSFYRPTSWLIEPTYVGTSKNSNLLICDGMGERIYELIYPPLSHVIDGQEFSSEILSIDSIAPEEFTSLDECGLISLQRAKSLALTIECGYHTSATVGVKVHIYSSYDGASWDTEELESDSGDPVFGDMPFTAGQIVSKTVNISCGVRYLKVAIENVDTTYSVSNVKAILTVTNY